MKPAPGKRRLLSRLLCATLSTSLAAPPVYAALPPASTGTQGTPASATGSGSAPARKAVADPHPGWMFPPIRIGGSIAYDWRHERGEERKMVHRGTVGTITAATETYIWEPWFARLDGRLSLSAARASAGAQAQDGAATQNSNQTMGVSGNLNLRILPSSRIPFSGYWSRNDNRFSSELLPTGFYVGQRIGFDQQIGRERGDAGISFDRSTQKSDSTGTSRQDGLQLRVSENRELHRLNAIANLTRNKHEHTGERAAQDNFTVQHTYAPSATTSLDSMFNATQSDFDLIGASSGARLLQATGTLFWRPEESPLTLSAGLRVLGASTHAQTVETGDRLHSELRNANANLGLHYELSPYTRITAGSNLGYTDSNGRSATTTSQNASIQYSPASSKLGAFDYGWNAGASVSNTASSESRVAQMTAQISHRLSRTFRRAEGEAWSAEVSQGVTTSASTHVSTAGEASVTHYLTHGGALGWNKMAEGVSSVMRFSVSDNRALGGGSYFQMFNLQATSNVPTGTHTSWNGSLTVQGTRQGYGGPPTAGLPGGGNDFVITSNGSLSYRNQRAFGVRGLRFTSDLRLTSAALLPLLGGPRDQETAAWENRLDYAIGRLNLRVATLVSQAKSPAPGGLSGEGAGRHSTTHRSIMFSVSRAFGD